MRLEQRRDLAKQIYRQLRSGILEGRLRAGDRLPPTRELARRLDVSRATVTTAYAWLESEGLLSGKRGGGTFVERSSAPRPRTRAAAPIRRREVWKAIAPPRLREHAPRFDFAVGMPDATLFPYDAWRRALARQVRPSNLDADYADPAGHPRLRAAIARYIAVSRGVVATAEDVVVTSGAQQAFDLIARVLLEPGDIVAVEEPGYPPARLLFHSLGARASSVRVDESGLVVSSLPQDARLVYVTPSHQFPLGMPMSHERRVELLQWAARRNAVIIEDDYDSEFRFGGRPLDTLQAIDTGGRVVYVGSFSKSLLPSLRLGFVIAPPALQRALIAANYVSSWFAQWPPQAALATFIENGQLARHVRKMRREYSARHEQIIEGLDSQFADWLDAVPSVTGMHLAARLRSGGVRRERDIAGKALRLRTGFDRLSTYYAGDHPQAGLVLGYGGIATTDIREGLRRLRTCF